MFMIQRNLNITIRNLWRTEISHTKRTGKKRNSHVHSYNIKSYILKMWFRVNGDDSTNLTDEWNANTS